MTDMLEPAVAAPSRRLPPRRQPATPTRRAPRADQQDVVDVAELARQNAALLERVQVLEEQRGRIPYVPAEPLNTIAESRVADDEELTPWQQQLRRETKPTPPSYGGDREPAYNVPERWFMKPDGSIVQLQGDSKNRAYYQDKGYRLLDRAEEKHYLAVEKPKIVRVQQQRANLINGMRRAIQLDPVLAAGLDPAWEIDLDHMTVPELQVQFDEIANTPTADGRPRRTFKRLPRLQDADDRRAQAEQERLLQGVETKPPAERIREFEAEIRSSRAGGRTVEVTARNANQFA